MLSDIRINCQRTRRVKHKDGGYSEATIGLSQIPASSTMEDILGALNTGKVISELIGQEVERALGVQPTPDLTGIFKQNGQSVEQNPPIAKETVAQPNKPKRREITVVSETPGPAVEVPLIDPARIEFKQKVDEIREKAKTDSNPGEPDPFKGDDEDKIPSIDDPQFVADPHEEFVKLAEAVFTPAPTSQPSVAQRIEEKIAAMGLPTKTIPEQIAEIPDPENVELVSPFTGVFGIGLRIPDDGDERWQQPLSEINADGTGHGQLMAVNAALTGAGFAKDQRHRAAEVLLNGIDRERPPVSITSTRDLSHAQAHIILSWFDQASPADLNRLGEAVRGVVV